MNKRKTNTIKIRVEEEMYQQLEQLAIDNNTSLSEVVRYLINKGFEYEN